MLFKIDRKFCFTTMIMAMFLTIFYYYYYYILYLILKYKKKPKFIEKYFVGLTVTYTLKDFKYLKFNILNANVVNVKCIM